MSDGYWQLSIPSVSYISPLDNSNLRRLFGDIDNNGTVEGAIDFTSFGAEFNSSGANLAFDFNNDGTVDGAVDFPAFGARFNTTL